MMKTLWNFIFPPTCYHCGTPVASEGQWCHNCFEQLLHIRPIGIRSSYIDAGWVLAKYEGGIRHVLHDIKFNGKKEHALGIAPFLSVFSFSQTLRPHYVVPVPVSASRLASRGYNQVDLLFKQWVTAQTSYYGKEKRWVWCDVLSKENSSDHMWHMSFDERGAQAAQAFSIQLAAIGQMESGKDILIVDDIYTTGATVESVAQVLQVLHPRTIYVLTWASGTV